LAAKLDIPPKINNLFIKKKDFFAIFDIFCGAIEIICIFARSNKAKKHYKQ
jgi:hypothetical protein